MYWKNTLYGVLYFYTSCKARLWLPFIVDYLCKDVCIANNLESVFLLNKGHICLLSIIKYLGSLNPLGPILFVAIHLGLFIWPLWKSRQGELTELFSHVFMLSFVHSAILLLIQESDVFHEIVVTYLDGWKVEWILRPFTILDNLQSRMRTKLDDKFKSFFN